MKTLQEAVDMVNGHKSQAESITEFVSRYDGILDEVSSNSDVKGMLAMFILQTGMRPDKDSMTLAFLSFSCGMILGMEMQDLKIDEKILASSIDSDGQKE